MSAILPIVDGARADVAQPLVYRQLLLPSDAQGLVELAARLQDVGDLAHRDCARVDVAQPLVDRQLFLASDAQRLVELARCIQDVGDLAHVMARERTSPSVHTPAAAPRVGCAGPRRAGRAREDVGDLAHGDGA